MVVFEARFGYCDILILGIHVSPIKKKQSPDMTIALVLDVKHQFKQTCPGPLDVVTSSNLPGIFFILADG